jgi:hypothetical protein
MVHMEHMGFPGARSCWYLELWDLQIPGVSLDFHLLRSRLPNALAYKRWRLADGQPQGGRRRVATYLWLLLSCLEERRSQRACGRQSARARATPPAERQASARTRRAVCARPPRKEEEEEREREAPYMGCPILSAYISSILHAVCHEVYTPYLRV